MGAAASSSNFNYGFPTPGPQNPTGEEVMDHVFFLSKSAWKEAREEINFDYIVIGTGPCALGFTERVLHNNPKARILMIERGPFFLPDHFQNLPFSFQYTLGGLSETFPWTLSAKTINGQYIKWQHGMGPFVGGRSTLWSTWCPRPTVAEMAGWPQAVIDTARKYFSDAEKLLKVIPADEINHKNRENRGTEPPEPICRVRSPLVDQQPIYGVLQNELLQMLEKNLSKIDSATRVIAAPLAAKVPDLHRIDFQKFATPGPLLELVERQKVLATEGKGAPLSIVTNCIVTKLLHQEGKATALETTRGVVNVSNTQVILAMGTIPPTTLVLNSLPEVKNAGSHFTAHFISSIVARIPRHDFSFAHALGELELAGIYVAGIDRSTQGQYHIQLTGISDKYPEKNAYTALRYMPDVVATASKAQLLSSEDYLVFVCAVLGEMDFNNPDNWLRRNEGEDPTTNVTLQAVENENDASVWNTMEEGTYQALEQVLSPKGSQKVEYWHGSPEQGDWKPARPPLAQIRVPGLVHEGSTLWIGENDEAPVGLDYRLKNGTQPVVDNVYVTGAGLWPRAGSWNPTLTMVALAQHLADSLSSP